MIFTTSESEKRGMLRRDAIHTYWNQLDYLWINDGIAACSLASL